MASNLVLEVGALVSDAQADDIVSYTVDNRHVGVVVKGSQGARWLRPDAAQLLHDAQSSGLQGAWLHYAEPGVSTAEAEATHLVSSLAGVALGLGVWLELPDDNGLQLGELGEWVRVFLEASSIPTRPVAIVCSTTVGGMVSGYLSGRRVVITEGDGIPGVEPWACLDDAELVLAAGLQVPVYQLRSTRGLVPVVLGEPGAVSVPADDENPLLAPGPAPAAPAPASSGEADVELQGDDAELAAASS